MEGLKGQFPFEMFLRTEGIYTTSISNIYIRGVDLTTC